MRVTSGTAPTTNSPSVQPWRWITVALALTQLVAPLVVGAAVRMLARLEDDGRRPLRLEPRSFSA